MRQIQVQVPVVSSTVQYCTVMGLCAGAVAWAGPRPGPGARARAGAAGLLARLRKLSAEPSRVELGPRPSAISNQQQSAGRQAGWLAGKAALANPAGVCGRAPKAVPPAAAECEMRNAKAKCGWPVKQINKLITYQLITSTITNTSETKYKC